MSMNICRGRKHLTLGAIGFVAFCFVANSVKADNTTIQDHYKNVIHKKPYQVEVCYDQQTSGDKTGDAIKGAIIGGLLGNNIKGEQDGGAIGAVIGGMWVMRIVMQLVEHELSVQWKLVIMKNVKLFTHTAQSLCV